MLDPRNRGDSQLKNGKWKVFVLLEQKKQGLILEKGSEVLYQVYAYCDGNLYDTKISNTCMVNGYNMVGSKVYERKVYSSRS